MKKHFTLSPVFSDNMIFQADKPIRIFGQCKKGIEINVSFLDQTRKLKTTSETFLFELEPVSYRDKGFSFTVFTKKQEQTIYQCVVGDIYLVVGGLNVSMPLKDSYHQADYHEKNVRYLDLNKYYQAAGELKNNHGWKISGIDNLENFSAMSYVIGKQLHSVVKVPIGIVTANHQETSIYSWMSLKEIHSHNEVSDFIQQINNTPKHKQLNPTLFFETMIANIIPMSLRSIIIYQGENDYPNINLYSVSLSRVIQAYRIYFKDSALPFIITQIAGYKYPDVLDDGVNLVRQVQANLMSDEKRIFVVSAIDLGDEDSLYLKDKHVLSKRIVYVILDKIYRLAKSSISPSYYSYSIQDDQIVIFTQNNYLNLISHSRRNLGFTYSIDGTVFRPVENIRLQNNQILIKKIEGMKEIRYAYDNYPVCDIYTTNELPLLPFRLVL